MSTREEFDEFYFGKYLELKAHPEDEHPFAIWQAATEDADAKWQAMVNELEYYVGNPSAWEHYDDGVSEVIRRVIESQPDQALQRRELEARIDEQELADKASYTTYGAKKRLIELRKQLAELEGE